jgi:hypothetical protein
MSEQWFQNLGEGWGSPGQGCLFHGSDAVALCAASGLLVVSEFVATSGTGTCRVRKETSNLLAFLAPNTVANRTDSFQALIPQSVFVAEDFGLSQPFGFVPSMASLKDAASGGSGCGSLLVADEGSRRVHVLQFGFAGAPCTSLGFFAGKPDKRWSLRAVKVSASGDVVAVAWYSLFPLKSLVEVYVGGVGHWTRFTRYRNSGDLRMVRDVCFGPREDDQLLLLRKQGLLSVDWTKPDQAEGSLLTTFVFPPRHEVMMHMTVVPDGVLVFSSDTKCLQLVRFGPSSGDDSQVLSSLPICSPLLRTMVPFPKVGIVCKSSGRAWIMYDRDFGLMQAMSQLRVGWLSTVCRISIP